jgi:hypothetical protein
MVLMSEVLTLDEVMARREMLAKLVRSYYPADKPIYRTMNNDVWTGEEMAQEILSGTDVGRDYITKLLEISRDLLARQAQKY